MNLMKIGSEIGKGEKVTKILKNIVE